MLRRRVRLSELHELSMVLRTTYYVLCVVLKRKNFEEPVLSEERSVLQGRLEDDPAVLREVDFAEYLWCFCGRTPGLKYV